jgi:alkaline phosphatase D
MINKGISSPLFHTILALSLLTFSCSGGKAVQLSTGYSIPTIDLAREEFRQVIVDREQGQYLGHPTTILLEDNKTLICVYPKGHGRGAIVMKRSTDGGLTWSERLPTPKSWETSLEVPTIHRTIDPQGKKRLILFSGLYPTRLAVSEDDGHTWSELEPVGDWGGIVVMGCVERLKNGNYMALFHDDGRFIREGGKRQDPVVMNVYKTISQDGGLTWSYPEVIASHPQAHLCEPGLIRSPDGKQIAVLLRENSRRFNSFVIFSDDEGETWSQPRELPGALTGDRHTGKYAPDGRLFITFRDRTHDSPTWGDWVGWIGTYNDIVKGREGQYRVRLMDNTRDADCAYPGLEILPDGTFVTTTYGHWTAGDPPYIICVRLKLEEVDALATSMAQDEQPVFDKQEFHSSFTHTEDRTWIGPEYWANRLQDWTIRTGRLECLEDSGNKPMRTVHLLTRRLGEQPGEFKMAVSTGLASSGIRPSPDSAAGFLFGAGGDMDFRAAALIHSSSGEGAGLFAGINGLGGLFIRDFTQEIGMLAIQCTRGEPPQDVSLRLSAERDDHSYRIILSSHRFSDQKEISRITLDDVEPQRLTGNLALVSHPGLGEVPVRYWFRDWIISGDKLETFEEDNCGPILSTGYTLNQNVLKLTAQMMPLGQKDSKDVQLQVKKEGQWRTISSTRVIEPGFTAPFRFRNWDSSQDTPYRVAYTLLLANNNMKRYFWEGTIRHDPAEKEEMVVAAFTGNHNVSKPGVERGTFNWSNGVWFPHSDIVRHVTAHRPDFLFFSGDQVYEGASPTGADVSNLFLDYLYKWYLWCWAFRDLTKDIPSVVIPDDHDVFHGNIWGEGGKATDEGLSGADAQDSGGYKYSPEFVNMVERTQTSHLPDPFDPTPAKQGIGVYCCSILYGGISFAVVEDRKFKSAPTPLLPEANVRNGWAQNPDFNAKKSADVPGAKLLGDRQLKFLEEWASDWSHGVWMKVLLSQTLFSNVATLPAGTTADAVVPQLEILPAEEYAENDLPVADMDSNGWPQTGRNKAIQTIRKGFAVHISGDQHLGSTIQYGVEDWNDSGYAICTPSVANFWPRRWFPKTPGNNQKAGAPKYSGEFEDGFGNKITVHAVSNPHISGKEPAGLHDLSPGYAIARFNRTTREISLENWPRWSDPDKPDDGPYPNWPVRLHQQDSYGRKAVAYLPEIVVQGMDNPVIQIVEESSGEIVYTIRINGDRFRPKVFRQGLYTVIVGEPGTKKMKKFEGIPSIAEVELKTLTVIFEP